MDRRSLIAWLAGMAGAGPAFCMPKDRCVVRGRPSLAIEPKGPRRWRVRSWEWRKGAWRPLIGYAVVTATGIELSGPIAAADQAEVHAYLANRSTA